MPQFKGESGRLGSLEQKTLRSLAEEGPQTIYGIYKRVASQYNSAWKACRNLEKKGFIQKFENKYWLTNKGVLTALADKRVSVKKLIRNIEQYKNKDFTAIMPFIKMLEEESPLTDALRAVASSVLLPLYEKGIDLDRKINESEMESLMRKLEEAPALKEFFEAFLKLREMVKGEGVKS